MITIMMIIIIIMGIIMGTIIMDPITMTILMVSYHFDGSAIRLFLQSFWSFLVECGGSLTDDSGVIKSPLHPGNYPASKECIWTIEVPDGFQVLLTFDENNFDVSWRMSRIISKKKNHF